MCWMGWGVLRDSRCSCGGRRCSSYFWSGVLGCAGSGAKYERTFLVCVVYHASLVLFLHPQSLEVGVLGYGGATC